jgi:hypothetical protein
VYEESWDAERASFFSVFLGIGVELLSSTQQSITLDRTTNHARVLWDLGGDRPSRHGLSTSLSSPRKGECRMIQGSVMARVGTQTKNQNSLQFSVHFVLLNINLLNY